MPKPALSAAENAARRVYDWTNVKLTREQTAQILYQAGFRGDALVNMVAIAGRESNYRPGIHGTASPKDRVSGDRGLFGINYSNDKGLIAAGVINSAEDLFDPLTNAKAAYHLSNGGTNLFPWGAMKGGWAAGGDPFYGTNRGAAATAVQNAANQGLLGQDYSSGGAGGGTAPGGTAEDPLGWGGIKQWQDQSEATFNAYLKTQTAERQAQIINELKQARDLGGVAEYMASAPQGVNDYINYLSALPEEQQVAAKERLVVQGAADPGAAPANPAQSQEITNLLQTFGVSYPNAPQPTPALLAFLKGIGLNLSTAEDVKRRAIERIGASTSDAMADIDRAAGRNKQNITADLVRRGILSSGESTTRYARQAEDVGAQQSDVTRTSAQAKETAEDAYRQSQDLARQQALDRVIGAEQEQATQSATAKAQADALKAQQAAADLSWQRQQQATSDALKQQTDAIANYAAQGVVV